MKKLFIWPAMKNVLFWLLKNIKKYLWSYQKVTDALFYLLDNIYIRFGSKLYRQNVGIPMGTNCALLLLICFCSAIMRQTACLVFNPIMVEGYAALSCTAVVQASDSMTASM